MKTKKMMVVLLAVVVILSLLAGCSPGKGSNDCWYCGRTIFTDKGPIHATYNHYGNYKCDYCGKDNVRYFN